MKRIIALVIAGTVLVGLASLWNTLGAEALPAPDRMPVTPIVQDRSVGLMEYSVRSSVSRLLYPRSVDTLSESRLNRIEGDFSESTDASSVLKLTNTPAPPGAVPVNTPAPPMSEVAPAVERVSPAVTVPERRDPSPPIAPSQELTPVIRINDDQDLARTEFLGQAVGRIDIPSQRPQMRRSFAPQSANDVLYADVLLNPQLNVVEFGDGTGSIEHWSILFQEVCYGKDDADPPDYSLVMNDGACSDSEDTDLIEGGTWDFDEFAQGFTMPLNPTAIRVSLSSVCPNENENDEARWWLYTLTPEGYLDEWKVSDEIPDNTGSFQGWLWELTAADYPGLFEDIAGQPMAVVYTMLGDLAEPSEVVWLDDLQVRVWYEQGSFAVYLPLVTRMPPDPSGPSCAPREPDSLTNPGSTAVGVTCGGSFNAVDQRDYYTLDLRGASKVQLGLLDVPPGTNWDALVYENISGYPLACQIGEPGDADRWKNCPNADGYSDTLDPSKDYFVLVSRGPNTTGGGYQMQLVDISDPEPPQWETIVNETFEGSFPGAWDVFDGNGEDYGEYYWKKSSCRASAGSYSGWPIGAGAQGGGLNCGANYPNNARSWMIYGPFSLADATAADLSFKLWINSQNEDGAANDDELCRYASLDGTNFYGTCTAGSSAGWIDRGLDLTSVYQLGDLTGESNVWIAFVFESNGSVNYSEGAFVDNVVLRKCTSPGCATMVSSPEDPEGDRLRERPAQETLERE